MSWSDKAPWLAGPVEIRLSKDYDHTLKRPRITHIRMLFYGSLKGDGSVMSWTLSYQVDHRRFTHSQNALVDNLDLFMRHVLPSLNVCRDHSLHRLSSIPKKLQAMLSPELQADLLACSMKNGEL